VGAGIGAERGPRGPASRSHDCYKRRLEQRLLPGRRKAPSRRIFLDRVEDKDRSYNREEILSIAQKHGFEAIVAGNLSLEDQARIFSEAEFITGPSGAQWTNLLFASPGARGLTWIIDTWIEFAAFRNLAHLSGAELRYLSVASQSSDFAHSDYEINGDLFDLALADLVAGD
jgi:capsular polysaccharide biosynthesis protein